MGEPMATETSHEIHFTQAEGGGFLAVSIDSPRFCVSASTEDAARAKAIRALDYFYDAKCKATRLAPRTARVISPVFEAEKICA
jgi:hypothetical protein